MSFEYSNIGLLEVDKVRVNSAYTLPTVDGTAGQQLTTNGSGVVSWGAALTTNSKVSPLVTAAENTQLKNQVSKLEADIKNLTIKISELETKVENSDMVVVKSNVIKK